MIRVALGVGAPAPEDAPKAASVALGNMDGVHLGHQAVVAAARRVGANRGLPLAAAVFEPHPRRLFQPDAPPFRLQSPAQRARALSALGVQALFEIHFDQALASLSDEAFCADVLTNGMHAKHVAVGADFRFGKGRAGTTNSLIVAGQRLGFTVSSVDAVDDGGASGDDADKISSTQIRHALAAGDPIVAARLLGRPWAIEGVVGPGAQRGRTIGFPTANVPLGDYLRPKFGVYAVRIDIGDGVLRAGVANLGVKPTVGGVEEPLLEAHVFDFSGDLYARRVEVSLIAFLREERRFESFPALLAQIEDDAHHARRILETD